MTGAAVYLILGLSLLLAIVLPQVTRRIALSPPMVLVAVGMALGLLPLADTVSLDPQDHRDLVTHVTEFTVLVSLMGVGLAIERTLDLRSWRSWRTWSPVWRLLGVTMPLTILGVAVLGWWVAGLAPAVALLLGAVLSPDRPGARLRRAGGRAAHRGHRRPRRGRRQPGRGRRHPLLPHRGGRPQRRPGLPVRAPRPAPDRRGLHPRGHRPLGRVVRRRQDRARRSGRHRHRLAAGPPGLPRPQRHAAPGRPRRAPARAGRTADGVRRSGAGRRLRLPRGLRLRDASARVRARAHLPARDARRRRAARAPDDPAGPAGARRLR